MNFDATTASSCRYGGVASDIWGDWDVLWEHSYADYQGHARFLAVKDDIYVFYEWSYGSCSGCDAWEAANYSDEQIEAEMRDGAITFSSVEDVRTWAMMRNQNPYEEDGNDILRAINEWCVGTPKRKRERLS